MNAGYRNQSYVSDELTHFVGRCEPTNDDRFKLLCRILGSRKLGTGRGNMRVNFPHNLVSHKLLVPEMVCFCDIPLHSINIHMTKYSRFGLAFTKVFMRSKGCNPVYYISMHSPCTDHRYGQDDDQRQVTWGEFSQKAFDEWFPTLPQENGRIDAAKLLPIQNLTLWYVFGHVKFFDSTLPDDHGENWYMEREWRIIGSMCFKLENVARVILPTDYVGRFRAKFPDFDGCIHEAQ